MPKRALPAETRKNARCVSPRGLTPVRRGVPRARAWRAVGKTLQTIAFLAHLKFVKKVSGPHLVICPLSVLSSWMTELKVRRHSRHARAWQAHDAPTRRVY